MTLTKQSILKAFYRLDHANIRLTNVDGRPVDHLNVEARKELCQIWLDLFCILDDNFWEKVIAEIIAECKEYPPTEQIFDIIERLKQNPNTAVPRTATVTQPPPVQPKSQSKSLKGQAKLNAMFELAKQGKFCEARQLVIDASVPDAKIVKFARAHWPDCTDMWIQTNKMELSHLVRYEEKCLNCVSLYGCPTSGYRYYGVIDKSNGGLSMKTAICQKKLERNGVSHENLH